MQNEFEKLDASLQADIRRQVEVFTEFMKSRRTPGKPRGWVTEPCGGCSRRGFVFNCTAVLFSNNKKRVVLCSLCKNCAKITERKRAGNRAYDRVQANFRKLGLSDDIETKTVSFGFVGGNAGSPA